MKEIILHETIEVLQTGINNRTIEKTDHIARIESKIISGDIKITSKYLEIL